MSRRPGMALLRQTLDRHSFTLTASELDRRFLPLARRAGLPLPVTGHYLNGFKTDFYRPHLGLVVETDGLRYHRTLAQQARDPLRDQAHVAATRSGSIKDLGPQGVLNPAIWRPKRKSPPIRRPKRKGPLEKRGPRVPPERTAGASSATGPSVRVESHQRGLRYRAEHRARSEVASAGIEFRLSLGSPRPMAAHGARRSTREDKGGQGAQRRTKEAR
jgi:hypothetical protein